MEAALSLGSNLGDRLDHLRQARHGLARLPDTSVTAVSAIYETEPVDVPARYRLAGFLNAIVIVETRLDAAVFSDCIHALETKLGRRRGMTRHAPRSIDIDIVYMGSLTLDSAALRIPHPEWSGRRFVCAPLADLRPNLLLPGETLTVSRILASLPERPYARPATEQW